MRQTTSPPRPTRRASRRARSRVLPRPLARKALPWLAAWTLGVVGPSSLIVGCGNADEQELPTYPVSLRLGGQLPTDGRVGEYTVTLSEGWVVVGDWHLYGMDREAAGYALIVDGARKHAGHAHGEAEMEVVLEGTWAIDLLGEPITLATRELTEGHYFDGSLRLRPCTDPYAPVLPDGADPAQWEPVDPSHDLWGHALLLRGEASRDASEVYPFEVVVDAEAMLAGLEYGGTVKAGGATRITTRLDLGRLLEGVDFAALAGPDDHVQLDPDSGLEAYTTLKVRLQDPALYLHEEAEAVPTE